MRYHVWCVTRRLVITAKPMTRIKLFTCVLALTVCVVPGIAPAATPDDELIEYYIEEWLGFYPSEALSNGLKGAAWQFEDFSGNRVEEWIDFNLDTLKMIDDLSDVSVHVVINKRILRRQANRELERWVHDGALANQSSWYAEVISQALTYILVREQFTPEEKFDAVLQRLQGVQSMSALGIANLQNGSPGAHKDFLSRQSARVDA